MRSAAVCYSGCEEQTHQSHFLESCFLCQKPLGSNTDIFMYRGNTPFCSHECRQEQIEIDEAKEKRGKMSSGLRKSSADPNTKTSQNNAVQTGTVI